MARTKRAVPYKHYWGDTKKEKRTYIDSINEIHGISSWIGYNNWRVAYIANLERDYLLHGTDSRNYCVGTHYYFNRANRIGRCIVRDQLRPHIVLSENFEFDDSRYRKVYKGVWWEIY